MKAVIPDPDIQAKAQAVGMEMRWSTPEDMTARMKADIAKWGAVIDKAGIAEAGLALPSPSPGAATM